MAGTTIEADAGKGRLIALFVFVASLESMPIFPLVGGIHRWLGIAGGQRYPGSDTIPIAAIRVTDEAAAAPVDTARNDARRYRLARLPS